MKSRAREIMFLSVILLGKYLSPTQYPVQLHREEHIHCGNEVISGVTVV